MSFDEIQVAIKQSFLSIKKQPSNQSESLNVSFKGDKKKSQHKKKDPKLTQNDQKSATGFVEKRKLPQNRTFKEKLP